MIPDFMLVSVTSAQAQQVSCSRHHLEQSERPVRGPAWPYYPPLKREVDGRNFIDGFSFVAGSSDSAPRSIRWRETTRSRLQAICQAPRSNLLERASNVYIA